MILAITLSFGSGGRCCRGICQRGCAELLYADVLVLTSGSIKGLRNKFLKRKKAFESKDFKVNLEKTKVIVSVGITEDGTSKSKFDPCGVSSLRVRLTGPCV